VVGAGVIGLAVARALALEGREVLVLEREGAVGTGVSARSSEVIHAGLYYPSGSAKARLCVRGRALLYRYCAERGVGHRRCGKVVVASGAQQLEALAQLEARARANGVEDVRRLSRDELRALEPELAADAALHSPSTGIVDSHGLVRALEADARSAGAQLVFHHEVLGGRCDDAGLELEVQGPGGERSRWRARTVVNAAGLHAVALAHALRGAPRPPTQRSHWARGHYFSLRGPPPFSRLVYPLPEPGGLGVHLTLDLQGRARFGPDVEWVTALDYAPDPGRVRAFEEAIRRYWPGLPAGALEPAYTGIRPKLAGPGEPNADFTLLGPREHGARGLVHLLGIESPGLTACLALAEETLAALRCEPIT
jgi:L-2-hydroxyglutarate oxidase LhgO